MHRASILVLLFLLPLQAFAAGDQCAARAISEQLGVPAEEIAFAEAEAEPLYAAVGDDLADGDRVAFEILVDGGAYLSEELEIVRDNISRGGVTLADVTAAPVVELLAANGGRLAHLYRIADQSRIEVVIRLNGELVRTAAFDELLAESRALVTEEIQPQELRSTVTLAAPGDGLFQKDACTNYCDDEQDDCYLNRCGQFGSASCYNACDQQWEDCLEGCGICTPSSSSSTTYTVVGLTNQFVSECHYHPFYGKGIFGLYLKRTKRTITTTTTNADCTQTVTNQVSYFNTYCWVWQYKDNYCFNLGTVYNLC